MSMHCALHFRSHTLHFTHLSVSIIGLNAAKRARKLSAVPTGQMLLQYVRPPRNAKATTTTSVIPATISTGTLL